MAHRHWNNKNKKAPPKGFEIIEPILDALENEVRDKIKESNMGKRNTESMWPIAQINWQRTRYVYDMYHTHSRIPRKVYDYCIKHKLIDANLISKWKKSGYERLCSTYVINPMNYKFGTTSICRVPIKERSESQRMAQDPTTGCFGCASGGEGVGPKNIFGNKYGQNLAAVQIAREKHLEVMRDRQQKQQQQEQQAAKPDEESKSDEQQQQPPPPPPEDAKHPPPPPPQCAASATTTTTTTTTGGGDSETDDDSTDDEDDDDYGPTPAAGIWAGSQKLEAESVAIAEGEEGGEERPSKKARVDE